MKYFTVKPLQPEDFQSLEKIDKSIFPIKSQQTIFANIFLRPNIICYVAHACLKTKKPFSFSPVGYITVLSTRLESEILSFGVYTKYRGFGIGKGLLGLTLKNLFLIDCSSVFLEVRKSNAVAKALYSKFGFTETGARPRYYSDNFEDAIVMSIHHLQKQGYASFLKSTLETLSYFQQLDN